MWPLGVCVATHFVAVAFPTVWNSKFDPTGVGTPGPFHTPGGLIALKMERSQHRKSVCTAESIHTISQQQEQPSVSSDGPVHQLA